MAEIIYVCKSINNKNVRQGELKILRKSKEKNQLCFEFGENEMNIKKRFYDNVEDFEHDFNALLKLQEKDGKEMSFEKEKKEEVKKTNTENKTKIF